MNTPDGEKLSEDQAIELARAFANQKGRSLGTLSRVRHHVEDGGRGGYFSVEFEYSGPPVKQKTNPPTDHPTVIIVSDRLGSCHFMMWM